MKKKVFACEQDKVRELPDAAPGEVLGIIPVFYGRKLVAMRSYDTEHPGIYIDVLDKNGVSQQLLYVEDVGEDDELEYAGNLHVMLNTRIGADDFNKEALVPHKDIEEAEKEYREELTKNA